MLHDELRFWMLCCFPNDIRNEWQAVFCTQKQTIPSHETKAIQSRESRTHVPLADINPRTRPPSALTPPTSTQKLHKPLPHLNSVQTLPSNLRNPHLLPFKPNSTIISHRSFIPRKHLNRHARKLFFKELLLSCFPKRLANTFGPVLGADVDGAQLRSPLLPLLSLFVISLIAWRWCCSNSAKTHKPEQARFLSVWVSSNEDTASGRWSRENALPEFDSIIDVEIIEVVLWYYVYVRGTPCSDVDIRDGVCVCGSCCADIDGFLL